MDPNETLKLARAAAERGDKAMVAYYFEIIDEWMSKGGFLPSAWVRPEDSSERR